MLKVNANLPYKKREKKKKKSLKRGTFALESKAVGKKHDLVYTITHY